MTNYEKELEKNKMAIQCYAGLVEVSLPKQLRGKHFSNIADLYNFILLVQKEHELLELYKKFVKTMQIDILTEEVYQYNQYLGKREYLDIGGATDLSIETFKKIKELKEEKTDDK